MLKRTWLMITLIAALAFAAGCNQPVYQGRTAREWKSRLKDMDPVLRREAVAALAVLAEQKRELLDLVAARLADSDAQVRDAAVAALSASPAADAQLADDLLALADKQQEPSGQAAAIALRRLCAAKPDIAVVLAARLSGAAGPRKLLLIGLLAAYLPDGVQLPDLGRDVTASKTGLLLVRAPGGSFTMGSPAEEQDRRDNETQHTVSIANPFFIGAAEVTRGAFAKFVSSTGYTTTAEKEGGAYTKQGDSWGYTEGASWVKPGFAQTDKHPVVCVSWHDAVAFCNWLSGQDGLVPCYSVNGEEVACDFAAGGYRLPTEAEWEYACRAGTASTFNTGANITTDQANYNGNVPYADGAKGQYRAATTPVGTFPPNDWGLLDMHGNVWEWCWDWYGGDYYANSPASDPAGPASGALRVLRGGSWVNGAELCRSAGRVGYLPGFRDGNNGFRVVRRAPQD